MRTGAGTPLLLGLVGGLLIVTGGAVALLGVPGQLGRTLARAHEHRSWSDDPAVLKRYYRDAVRLPDAGIPVAAEAIRRATGQPDPTLGSLYAALWLDRSLPRPTASGDVARAGEQDLAEHYSLLDGRVERSREPIRDSLHAGTRQLLEESVGTFRYSQVPWVTLPGVVGSVRSACRGTAPRSDVVQVFVSRLRADPEPTVSVELFDPDTGRRAAVDLPVSRLSSGPAGCDWSDPDGPADHSGR